MIIKTSPVASFPGTISLPDYYGYPAYLAWMDGIFSATQFLKTDAEGNFVSEYKEGVREEHFRFAHVPGIIACVAEWNIKGLPSKMTPEAFPFSPERPAREFYNWLHEEIRKHMTEQTEIPNELLPGPTDTQATPAETENHFI